MIRRALLFHLLLAVVVSSLSPQLVFAAEPPGGLAMTARQGYVTTDDGVRLYFHVVGAGADVVIVPLALYLSPEFDVLASGRTLVYYDPRNRGRSDQVTDPAKLQDLMHREVEDLEAVRRHFGVDRVDLIGHSYAGIVVGLYAMKYAHHVRRLVQIGPGQFAYDRQYPAEFTNNDAVRADVFAKLMALQQQQPPSDPEAACRAAWVHLRRLQVWNPDRVDRIGHWGFCELPNERGFLASFNRYMVPSWRNLGLGSDDFARATMPTLIIHGLKDRNAPYGGGRDWAVSLPDARLISIEQAAHAAWIDAPQLVFDSIAQFLAGTWPAVAAKVQ